MSVEKLLEQLIAQKSFSGNCFSGAIGAHTLPNGLMPPEQANKFIDETVDESVLLGAASVWRTDSCQGKIDKLSLDGPVTSVAASTSCPKSASPSQRTLYYDLVKYRSYYELENDFLKCNIEKEGFADTFRAMFSKAMANDAETLAIQADSSIDIGEGQSEENNMLGANDGWLKQICSCIPECNVLDVEGAGPSKEMYHEALKKIPSRFRGNRSEYRWIGPYSALDAWTSFWSGRATDAGDAVLAKGVAPGPYGVPFMTVPRWPEDLAHGSTDNPVTHLLLMRPKNLIYVTDRTNMKFDTEKVPLCDKTRFIFYWWADFLIRDAAEIVLVKNIDPCGEPYDGCVSDSDCKFGTGTNPCE